MCYAACAALRKTGKLNEATDVLEKSSFKSSEGFKLNTPVWRKNNTHTHTHCSGKIRHIRKCVIFFFCFACKKPPDGKMQKKESQQKGNMIS